MAGKSMDEKEWGGIEEYDEREKKSRNSVQEYLGKGVGKIKEREAKKRDKKRWTEREKVCNKEKMN